MAEPAVFEITLPAEYRDDAITAFTEAGAFPDFTVQEFDARGTSNELKFDPFTIAAGIVVLKFVGLASATLVVEEGLKKLWTKVRSAPRDKGRPPVKVVVVLPDTTSVTLVGDDPEAVEKLLRGLTGHR